MSNIKCPRCNENFPYPFCNICTGTGHVVYPERLLRRQKKWFIKRVGKRVFRHPVECKCKSCTDGTDNGVLIHDITHANYLFDIQNEMGLEYFDKKP